MRTVLLALCLVSLTASAQTTTIGSESQTATKEFNFDKPTLIRILRVDEPCGLIIESGTAVDTRVGAMAGYGLMVWSTPGGQAEGFTNSSPTLRVQAPLDFSEVRVIKAGCPAGKYIELVKL